MMALALAVQRFFNPKACPHENGLPENSPANVRQTAICRAFEVDAGGDMACSGTISRRLGNDINGCEPRQPLL